MREENLRLRKEDLLQLGRRRFGPPSTETEATLRSITDPDRLCRMIVALLDASNWEELLATP